MTNEQTVMHARIATHRFSTCLRWPKIAVWAADECGCGSNTNAIVPLLPAQIAEQRDKLSSTDNAPEAKIKGSITNRKSNCEFPVN